MLNDRETYRDRPSRQRSRPYRFCVWGGGPHQIQIGSIEDRFYVSRANRGAAIYVVMHGYMRTINQLGVWLTAMAREAERVTLTLARGLGMALGEWVGQMQDHQRAEAAYLRSRMREPDDGMDA